MLDSFTLLHLDSSLSSFPISVFYLLYFFYFIFLRGASEGKLVVLSLAIGVAEQDDFANIPDLQETAQAAPPANQEPPPEKRYQMTRERACVCVCVCLNKIKSEIVK